MCHILYQQVKIIPRTNKIHGILRNIHVATHIFTSHVNAIYGHSLLLTKGTIKQANFVFRPFQTQTQNKWNKINTAETTGVYGARYLKITRADIDPSAFRSICHQIRTSGLAQNCYTIDQTWRSVPAVPCYFIRFSPASRRRLERWRIHRSERRMR